METVIHFLPGLHLRSYEIKVEGIVLYLATVKRSASCPHCHRSSRRIHSRYIRTLADLPCFGRRVCLQVQVRRFFCRHRRCPYKTFAEAIADVAVRYARRTQRLNETQTQIAQYVGSRPGARLVDSLACPTSPTTLLRQERAAPLPQSATPRVLGVDDWAFLKGQRYGTILIDLETHQVVDLLSERSEESVSHWLKEHPGVQIISRDRAEVYARGATQGCPDAEQIADRWHLIKNAGQALERLLEGKRSLLKEITGTPSDPTEVLAAQEPPPLVTEAFVPGTEGSQPEQQKHCHRQYRLERYQTVQALFSKGLNLSEIARHLHLTRHTVRKLVRAEQFPERKERPPRSGKLRPYLTFLLERWKEGCHNAALLYKQIQAKGYSGGYSQVTATLQRWRHQEPHNALPPHDKLSPRQVSAWILRQPEERTPRQQFLLDRLEQECEPFRIAKRLVDRFLTMVRLEPRQDQSVSLQEWLSDALASGVSELCSYARSLQQDIAAVTAGLSQKWSNGPTEGSVNRLKFVKRRGYGRANFDLLRRRVLQPT